MLPPSGGLVIGPCPHCGEMIVVFCGSALALEKDIIIDGTQEERHEHLMSVLGPLLRAKVAHLVEQFSSDLEMLLEGPPERAGSPEDSQDKEHRAPSPVSKGSVITEAEFRDFVRYDLPRLDDRDYFRLTFG